MLTNVRTFVQFSQYGNVIKLEICANKLRALNIVKASYGIKSVSILNEYFTTGYLIEGTVLELNN